MKQNKKIESQAPEKIFENAYWIWAENNEKPDDWVVFRRKFSLEKPPKNALARIAAESNYTLYINGKMVVLDGALKHAGGKYDGYYDELDIAPYLSKGDNALVFVCHYFGANVIGDNADCFAALIFECGELNIASDSEFSCYRSAAYKSSDTQTPSGLYSAYNLIYDFTSEGQIASMLEASYESSIFTPSKEYEQYSNSKEKELKKRPIPLFDFSDITKAKKITKTTDLLTDTYVVELPEVCLFYPYIEIVAEIGLAEINISSDRLYSENVDINDSELYRNQSIKYLCNEGEQKFASPIYLSGKQIILTMPSKVKLKSVGYRTTYFGDLAEGNNKDLGYFKSSDESLNKIKDKAIDTLKVCMRDTLWNTPDRERAISLGEASADSELISYAFGDNAIDLVKKCVLDIVNFAERTDYRPVEDGDNRICNSSDSNDTITGKLDEDICLDESNSDNLADSQEQASSDLDTASDTKLEEVASVVDKEELEETVIADTVLVGEEDFETNAEGIAFNEELNFEDETKDEFSEMTDKELEEYYKLLEIEKDGLKSNKVEIVTEKPLQEKPKQNNEACEYSILKNCVPCGRAVEVPMQSLMAIGESGIIAEYYHRSGDINTLSKCIEPMAGYLKLWSMGIDGMVKTHSGERRFFDHNLNVDEKIIENCLYYSALKFLKFAANVTGTNIYHSFVENRIKSINENFDSLFYKDGGYSSSTMFDDRANALSVIVGLANPSHYKEITKILSSVYNASPYMENYCIEALMIMNQKKEAVLRLKNRYNCMIESTNPTIREDFGLKGSHCQASSGAVVKNLYRHLAGVQYNNGKSVTIRPDLTTVSTLDFVVGVADGDISGSFRKNGERIDITINVKSAQDVKLELIGASLGINIETREVQLSKGKNKFTL